MARGELWHRFEVSSFLFRHHILSQSVITGRLAGKSPAFFAPHAALLQLSAGETEARFVIGPAVGDLQPLADGDAAELPPTSLGFRL